jgi:hypothetical protein
VKIESRKSKIENPACPLRACGLTIVELMLAMAISTVLVLVVGVLLASGQRSWNQVYGSANKTTKQDAQTVATRFGSIGRRANRLGYVLYVANGGSYVPAQPQTSDEEIVCGDAVEFRFWDVELDKTDSHQLMDVTKPATAYAFFYIDDHKLKVDYGPYPSGAVPAGGGKKNTTNITTTILAGNVTPDAQTGPFSHTTVAGVGRGCVRINITLTDPQDGSTTAVKTATLMRNTWPR